MALFIRIVLFILLAPILAGSMKIFESILFSKTYCENSEPVQFKRYIQHIRDYVKSIHVPWPELGGQSVYHILYVILTGISGVILFAGGSLARVFLLLVFADGIMTWYTYKNKFNCGNGKYFFDEFRGIIHGVTIRAALLLTTTAGFYCLNAIHFQKGDFTVSSILKAGVAPAFYMPAMLVAIIWILVYGYDEAAENGGIGSDSELHLGSVLEERKLPKLLHNIGKSYKMITMYTVLFLINYGGTATSAVISAVICLLVMFFKILQERNPTAPMEFTVYTLAPAILLLAVFINLFILL